MKLVKRKIFIFITVVVILILAGGGCTAGMALPGEEWNRTYGDGNNYYWAEYLQQTQDGGYVILATMKECGDCYSDVWLLKTDSNGKKQWLRTFGGPDDDWAEYMLQTNDGGYIIAVLSRNNINFSYIWLVKTDSEGNEQWNTTFGQIDDRSEFFLQEFVRPYGDSGAESLQQIQDNGYIIMGSTQLNLDQKTIWLVKLDSTGNVQWNRTLGKRGIESYEKDFSFDATYDGGHIILKRASIANGSSFTLVKHDSKGIEQWNRSFSGIDRADFFQQTEDGGYIIVRRTYGLRENGVLRLIKFDLKGNEQWNRSFEDYFFMISIKQTYDGGYFIAGSNLGTGSWIIKTDSDGFEQWNNNFEEIIMNFIQQTSDGGYLIAGHERISSDCIGDYVIVRIDSKGNVQWRRVFQDLDVGNIFVLSKTIEQTSDGGYILTGDIQNPRKYYFTNHIQLIKLKKEGITSASFTYYPKYPRIGQMVTFDASSSYAPEENITQYQWVFGDGTHVNTTEKIITHSYTSEGMYTVNLTILDNKFALHSLAKIIKVQNITADSDNRGNTDFWPVSLEVNRTEPAETGSKSEISGFIFLITTGSLVAAYFILRSMEKE